MGGAVQMTALGLGWVSDAIPCVAIPEFGGLAQLPDDPANCSFLEPPHIRSWRCRLPFAWLISTRWPSGSRKKQRISAPSHTGAVSNAAPWPAAPHRPPELIGVRGRSEDHRGLAGGRAAPLTSSQNPANRGGTSDEQLNNSQGAKA
jgi:hypothetical protein